MNNPKVVNLLLRIGLASVYLYAGVFAILSPNDWIGFLPQFTKNFFPPDQLLLFLSVLQILLGVWLLTGIKTFYAALVAGIMIIGIIAVNLNALDITFRDFTILFASAALAVGTYSSKKK